MNSYEIQIKTVRFLILIFLLVSCNNDQKAEEWYNKGLEKYKSEDYREAIKDLNKAIKLNPSFEKAFFQRGLSKGLLKDNRGAIADFSKAIKLNPEYVDAYFWRGASKIDLGDNDGGCLDWSKAGELGDDTVYEFIEKYCN